MTARPESSFPALSRAHFRIPARIVPAAGSGSLPGAFCRGKTRRENSPSCQAAAPGRPSLAHAGFTLLEALIALIIVGVALGVLFQVVSGSLNLSFHGREQFVVTEEAMAVFDMVAPRSLVWEELEWGNRTDTAEWSLTLHPVILRDSFERTGIAGGQDLFKLVFDYRDLATGRTVRLFSYRREEQDRLRVFLEKNREHVMWDEYDQFAEYITP